MLYVPLIKDPDTQNNKNWYVNTNHEFLEYFYKKQLIIKYFAINFILEKMEISLSEQVNKVCFKTKIFFK